MSVNGQVKADSLPPAVAGGSVEGTISKVDAVSGTIQISSGLLGLVGKTLQLSEDTLVKIGDREASLTEISEGSKVTAFYETRNRKYIATYIDLVPKFRMPERPFNVDPRIAL
jgi:Cu/Ag efflux protein CusF